MNIEIKTNKGNEFDIKDSIYSSSIGEYESVALSFYNIELQFGISYYPDKNMIVFQNSNVDNDYWNDDKIAVIEKELSKHLPPNYESDDELDIDFDYIVNYILDEMDNYYDWLNEKYKDFADYLKAIFSDVWLSLIG